MKTSSSIILTGIMILMVVPMALLYSHFYVDNLALPINTLMKNYPKEKFGTIESIWLALFVMFGIFGPAIILLRCLLLLWWKIFPLIIKKLNLS